MNLMTSFGFKKSLNEKERLEPVMYLDSIADNNESDYLDVEYSNPKEWEGTDTTRKDSLRLDSNDSLESRNNTDEGFTPVTRTMSG